jgi:hypothetical protein
MRELDLVNFCSVDLRARPRSAQTSERTRPCDQGYPDTDPARVGLWARSNGRQPGIAVYLKSSDIQLVDERRGDKASRGRRAVPNGPNVRGPELVRGLITKWLSWSIYGEVAGADSRGVFPKLAHEYEVPLSANLRSSNGQVGQMVPREDAAAPNPRRPAASPQLCQFVCGGREAR